MESPDQKRETRFGFLRALRTVLSAFIGIRRASDSKEDLAKLSPLQIIVTAVVCAAVLMGGLLILVRQITTPG